MSQPVILPGIRSIAWISIDELPSDFERHALSGEPLPLPNVRNAVNFSGFPECSVTRSKTCGGYYETATLKFHSNDILPIKERICLVIEDMRGNTFLLGSSRPPFPEFKAERAFSRPGSDPADLSYEVSFVALSTLIKCHR